MLTQSKEKNAPRVLVTGATGFVGRHLIRHLRETAPGARVTGTTLGADGAGDDPEVALVRCDLSAGGDDLRRLVAGAAPDHVYHLAGAASGAASDRAAVFAANVTATRHLLAAVAEEAPLARLLFASTGYVYGPCDPARPAREGDPTAPRGAYAESKREAEHFALAAGAVVARAFNHTGPGQTAAFAVPAFARQIAQIERGLRPPRLSVGNLEARRDFLDVRDVVRAYRLLLGSPEAAGVCNVCRGESVPLQSVLDGLLALSSVPVAVAPDPARMRPDDFAVSAGDPARLRALTGWGWEIPLARTLRDTLDWWRGSDGLAD